MIDGILPIDKPMGWTSHDIVARLRRIAGQRAVGHAGTLDPLATGALILVLGAATRLSSYLMNAPKVYCAEIVLGATTVTDDAEAPLSCLTDVSDISEADIQSVLARFVGTIDQVPPAYAAIKRGGQKLYQLARKGIEVEPVPRRVTITAIEIITWDTPRLRLRIGCESGTYIRSLARDIGAVLGVGGYLHALRRISSGSFTAEALVSLTDLIDASSVAAAVFPLDRAVLDLPAVVLDADDLRRVRHGGAVALGVPASGTVRLYGPSGTLVALAECRERTVHPIRVFEGETSADHA